MDIQFPYEDAVRVALQQRLSTYFDVAGRLLRFWLEMDKDSGLERSTLPPIVLRVALAMNVRACRQFRSVIELCERGEAVDAAIIARSMFETAQVMAFVLRPRVVPRKFDSRGKVEKRLFVPGVKFTREFRAALYVAHHAFEPERFAGRHRMRPGMKRIARRMKALSQQSNIIAEWTAKIGQGWRDLLMQHPFTYSGLSIANLARSLGKPFPRWYDTVYGPQSEHVHPADLAHHIEIDADASTKPRWHEPVEETRQTSRSPFFIC
ncbi:MAG: hypothetical protein EXS05_06460 [Planctomycetaceae bacterium]|nr:hypothetical protein [Planctomycetaceae bacterium]